MTDVLAGLIVAAAVPIFVTWLVFAFVSASAAKARGRGPGSWFMMGLIFGPISILLLALFPVDQSALEARDVELGLMKRCPFCRRAIATLAIKCRHCYSVISPLAYTHRCIDLKSAEESVTPRGGIEKTLDSGGHPRLGIDVISQAIHLCGGGVPPKEAAAQLDVSEESVRLWINRYMEDDAWMRRVDLAAVQSK